MNIVAPTTKNNEPKEATTVKIIARRRREYEANRFASGESRFKNSAVRFEDRLGFCDLATDAFAARAVESLVTVAPFGATKLGFLETAATCLLFFARGNLAPGAPGSPAAALGREPAEPVGRFTTFLEPQAAREPCDKCRHNPWS